jgi:hypothetical protein
MIARILNRFAARRLSRVGHQAQRDRILAKARALRDELGLPPSNALET